MNVYLQQILFFYILKSPRLTESYRPNYFEIKHLQILFEIAKPFVLEYKAPPTLSQMVELVKMSDKSELISEDTISQVWETQSKLSEYTEEWLEQNARAFGQWQNLISSLKKTSTYVKSIESDVNFENCQEVVDRAKNIFQHEANFSIDDKTLCHDFMEYETHEIKNEDVLASGYKFIDDVLGGGMAKKSLYCFVGGMKTGKSMWLGNLAAESVKKGQNVAYITLELSYQTVAKRIGSNLYNIPIFDYKDVLRNKPEFEKKMKAFNQNYQFAGPNGPGKLMILEYPTSSTTIDKIESDLLDIEEKLSEKYGKPFKFDKILIDYLAIMADAKNPRSENTYLKLKNISEGTRACMQRNNWIGVTVNQLNRGGLDNSDPKMSDMSEGISLGMTVDGLFMIIRTSIMNANSVYYLKAELARDSGMMGCKKKFTFDKNYLRIQESNDPIIQEGMDIPDISVGLVTPSPSQLQSNSVGCQLNMGVSAAQILGQPIQTKLDISEASIEKQDLW